MCSCVTLQADENLGMVMIFTLVTAVQEKLNEIVDVMKNRREEEKRRKEKEAEEAEKVGTGWIYIDTLTIFLYCGKLIYYYLHSYFSALASGQNAAEYYTFTKSVS